MIETKKDGRTVRTGKDYTEFRAELYKRQGGRCAICHRYTMLTVDILFDASFHVHHRGGRGMGGSKRDDTHEVCKGLCGACHREEHHQ